MSGTPSPFSLPQRVVLEGAVNFRDLGGHTAANGRRLRPGLLFRADSLAELSAADQTVVAKLGLRSLFDLRHESERKLRPNRLPPGSLLAVHELGFFPHGAHALMEQVKQKAIGPEEARRVMQEMYRHMPVAQAPQFAMLLARLNQDQALPALVHCTSGKDRTGMAIAVILLALGVPREAILADYLLTNHFRRDLAFMLGTDVVPEMLDVVKGAEAGFLLGAFDAIDTHWGGVNGFLRRGLGLGSADQARLQERLLEP